MDTSRIPIVLGYMLILILIATIGYAYYNEEQTLVSMETESRNTNNVRCEINRLNMRLTSLTMMGETAFEWTETERGDYRKEQWLNHYRLVETGLTFRHLLQMLPIL